MVIYLDRPSPDGSSGLPGSRRAALCFLFGLASSGVCMCPPCYHWGGSLLHCLSTLTCFHAVYFCCTVPEVAFAGRYPASCPVKPGLSSPASLRTAAATICLTQNLFILAYIFFNVHTCVYIFHYIFCLFSFPLSSYFPINTPKYIDQLYRNPCWAKEIGTRLLKMMSVWTRIYMKMRRKQTYITIRSGSFPQ